MLEHAATYVEPTEIKKTQVNVKKAGTKTTKKDTTKSNKFMVWELWSQGETDIDKLHDHVEQRVQRATIKNWTGTWKKGVNLPRGAK